MTIQTIEIEQEFAVLGGVLRTSWAEVEDYFFDQAQDEDFIVEGIEEGAKLCCPMCGSDLEIQGGKQ
ncbi:MAG: hypothetical protein LW689_06130 [Novosphingobium sp.]|jgi:hypothetical protein|nr:hypothetical protein [Novosphingobium sp.]MCE2842345.1 hypothetical protein [Novosphingobium sp.]